MEITLSSQLAQGVATLSQDYGYKSKKAFVEDAVSHWDFEVEKR